MKRIFTLSIFTLIFLSVNINLFAQCIPCNDKDYANKKAEFWNAYLGYKYNIDHNIVAMKPVDPSGYFVIDENNHFNMAPQVNGINNWTNVSAPWIIGGERDLASQYAFSQSTTTYTSIYLTGVLDTNNCDDGYKTDSLGFTFYYNGNPYTTISRSCNGWLMMGAGLPTGYSPICTGSFPNVVAAFARDLRGGPGASDNGIYRLTSGTAPNRVFTIEWYHWGIYSTGNNEIDFQIKLYETSNVIQVIYKPETPQTSITDVQVGLMGATNADYNTRTTTTNWSSTTSGVACSYCTFNSSVYPASGLTFTWTPPSTGPMGYLSSNTVQIAPNVIYTPGTVNNQIIQITVADTGVSNPLIINGLKLETTGSNNPAVDIAFAKLWYTRSSGTFSTVRQYGTSIANPSGVMNFTDTASLDPNATNYFWLTYDIASGAVSFDSVDAQCDSIFGSAPMNGVVPTVVAPAGSNPLDVYCRGQVSNAGCNYDLYVNNVSLGSINNTTGCTGVLPYMFNNYTNLSTVVRQNNTYSLTASNVLSGNINPCNFGTWVDWNNNNSFADGGEFFLSTTIAANSTTPSTTNIVVPSGATLGNHRMRIRANLASSSLLSTYYCTTLTYGEQEDYTLVVRADTNMNYLSSTTTQTVVSPIYTPSANTQIIGMQVVTDGTISPLSATGFSFSTTGTSHPLQDITSAKVYFTGTNPNFSTSTLVGVAVGPSGTFTITGSQTLAQGTNYLWLTYDIPASAPSGDTVDAVCNSITIGGVARVPTVTSPPGFRIIQGTALCGTYNIPGNYPSVAAAITDLNSKGSPVCAVTFNVAAGWTEVASNLTITSSGSINAPITFQKSGTGANPRIVAAPGTGTYDGIIKLYGVNYITFDGIDVSDTSANTTTTTQMEWGYALLRPDGTHGDQYITIKNSNISLIKTNTASYGIYSYNMNLTGTIVTPTSPLGSNSNNSFLSNNISSCYNGMYVYGYYDPNTPYSLQDHDNTISTIGTGRSSITNFGGSTTSAYGIYIYYQSNPVISNTYINSRGGVNSTGYLYGIYSYNYYNTGNSTITGDTVTLVDTTGSTGYQYAIYNATYYGNQVNISNNVVTGCVNPTASYYSYYIYNASGAMSYLNSIKITNNKVFGNQFGVAGSTTTYTYNIYNGGSCAQSIDMSNNLDSGNTIYGTTSYSSYRIYNGGATLNFRMNNNRVVNDTLCGTTATSTIYGVYAGTGGYTSTVVDSNVVMNNVLPSTSSAAFYMTYCSSPANSVDFSNNILTGTVSSGTGAIYGMYFGGSPYYSSTVNINNNTITNLQKVTSTGTGTIYGLYHGGSGQGVVNINNNTVTGFTSAAATTYYGIYQGGSPPNWLNVNYNKVGNLTTGGASVIYGIYDVFSSTTTQPTVTGDSVFNLNSLGGTIYGMYVGSSISYGNPIIVNNNRILGLTSTTGTTAYVYGLYISGGILDHIYNNFISDLKAPASTNYATPAITGLYINAGTSVNVYYNTILLKAVSSSSTTFGTAALYASTGSNLDLRNNVFIDSSTPGPTGGVACAYRRSSTILTTYLSASNNNCFYAGTPSATHLIFYDGTNLVQTLAAYKTFVVPRDNNSASEYPPFVNSLTAPYDLRIQTGSGTQLESGGQIISTSGLPIAPINITQDAFGTPRYPNAGYPVGTYTPVAPDMGADEFGGTNADLIPPFISYSPLGIGGTANRVFNNVIITDQSGVNVTTGTKPRCYYKRSTDSNVVNDNTNTTDGWKYVEASGTTSPFTFTIDYSLLNGGTGVIAGNVIQYFVIAQDLASTPNVGSNQATFTVAPTTVALSSTNAPISSTLSYTIGTNAFSGTYQVGASQTYTSLTGAAGIFAAINSGTVTGDVTIQITSNTVEDGTNALNLTNETGVGGYKIRIVPDSATMRVLSGTSTNTNGLIRLNGVKRVTIDGQNGLGTGKYLTFSNLYGSTPTFGLVSDAIKDSIKYCFIESNNIGTTSGTILFGAGATWGNDSNTIAYCDIKDTSGYNSPANAIISNGSTTNLQMYNNYNTIIGCNIYNWFYDGGVYTAGVYLNTGTANWVISNNSIYQTVSRTVNNASTFVGIFNNSTTAYDIIITNNYIGGSAPSCGGSAMTYSGPGLYNYFGIYLYSGGLAPCSIQGNTIQNINLTTSPASSSSSFFRGIYVGYVYSWVNIGNIAGNTIGSSTGNGSITLTTNTTTTVYSLYGIFDNGFGAIMNNIIGGITWAGNSTGTGDAFYGIYYYNSSIYGQTYTISNNLIGSLTTANSISLTNTADFGQYIHGIYGACTYGSTMSATNNTVANITSYNAAVSQSFIYGIRLNYYSSVDVTYNITGNTVRNLTVNTNYTGTSFVLVGVMVWNYYGYGNISQNTVSSLYSYGTTGATVTCAIQNRGYTGGNISVNKVYDLRTTGAGTIAPTPNLIGLNLTDYGAYTVFNNMFSITNGDATDKVMMGLTVPGQQKFQQVVVEKPEVNPKAVTNENLKIVSDAISRDKKNPVISIDSKLVGPSSAEMENSGKIPVQKNMGIRGNEKNPIINGPNSAYNCGIAGIYYSGITYTNLTNIYYNTVYVGGSQTGGAYNSWDFLRTSTNSSVIRNNLFINARTGNNNYCISNQGSLVEGWPVTASNYNVFICSNDATVGEWGLGNSLSLAGWLAATGGDNQTWSTNTSVINPSNLLTSISTADLSINTANSAAWIVSGKGIAIANVNTDFTGDPRSTSITTGVTDIGADEFTATPPSNPSATQIGTPAAGATTSYILYGRTICTINWGTGGTSYPSSMAVNYYSGIAPSNTNTLGSNYGTSYWTVTPTGNLTGASYSITIAFGDNETYTITSPSTNTLLAKYNTTGQVFWQTYGRGSQDLQSFVNWPNSISVTGLRGFSNFALADGALAVNLISPANYATFVPLTDTLTWSIAPSATSYLVQLSTDSTFATTIVNDSSVTATSRIVSGLTVNQPYFWRVRPKSSTLYGAYSAVFKFTPGFSNALVNLKVIPGGFYNTSFNELNMKDTVRIILFDSATCTKVDSVKAIIDSVTFTAAPTPSFTNANTGKYYIFVYHRNHLPVASMYTQQITRGSTVSYDFTSDSAKTYGFNAIKVSTSPVLWGMIPGDANRDEYVDALDQVIWLNENGQFGFYASDFNGDSYVDALDQFLWILYNGSASYLPCVSGPQGNPVISKRNSESSNYWRNVMQQNQIRQNNSNNLKK